MSCQSNNQSRVSTVGLLLSGGLDSSILLAYLLQQGRPVQPIFVRSGLIWESDELHALRRFIETVGGRPDELVVLDLPLGDLYGDHWSITGRMTPDSASDDEAVYLPGRNALLLVKAVVWCQLNGIDELALGVLASNPFADATAEFFNSFEAALNRGPRDGFHISRPFAGLDKREVIELGRDMPLELTFSCISPTDGLHCGRCNKCAERQSAFRAANIDDRTKYATASRLGVG